MASEATSKIVKPTGKTTAPRRNSGESLYRVALVEAQKGEPNYIRVHAKLQQAIRKGNPQAAYALATWLLVGKEPVVKPDHKKAVKLLRQAVAAGIADAMWDLAICYERGAGVPTNRRLAYELYLRAAIRGDSDAVMEVGRSLYWGLGTRANRKAAKIWLDRARELGTFC